MSYADTSKAILETIGGAGYRVTVCEETAGGCTVMAVGIETGQTKIVQARDLYEATVELAFQLGIELEDG